MGLILGVGRSPRGGNGNPLQYSCWEDPMDRGARWATVHRVAKGQTRLSDRTQSKRITGPIHGHGSEQLKLNEDEGIWKPRNLGEMNC